MITFDSLMLKAFLDEQKDFISGARVNKIQQPTRRELILSLRNNGETKQLYINIDTKLYHICFMSDENSKKRLIEIPQKPPMFCMLLRKYLLNSKISKVAQYNNERIFELYFEAYNELNDKIYLCLAVELMGKYSNVILYNTDTNIILGCAHNVGADKSQVREVYGTIPYVYPPLSSDSTFLNDRYAFLNSFNYNVYSKYGVNDTIDSYYSTIIAKDKFKRLKVKYSSALKSDLNKINKSLKEMYCQVNKKRDADKFRLYGDLLMANLYNLKDYDNEASVFDYENNEQVRIPLKETKTVKENANDYYKKYNKSKTAVQKLSELIELNTQNKEYLESILYSLEIAQGIEDLKDIEQELRLFVKDDKNIVKSAQNDEKNKNSLLTKSQIFFIEKPDQTRIYIGKNNKQNDYIVSKLSSDDDLWFHTKDCPGSHVLLKSQNITDELILECANLAKKYSSASDSTKVGVIYTKRKYLRKPPKAALGYVTYKNEKEIIID